MRTFRTERIRVASKPKSVANGFCLLGMLTAAQWGCSGQWRGSGQFEVTDSAGVTIVVNELNERSLENVAQWGTEVLLTIGQVEGPEEYSFGQIADVEVDHHGYLYVLDRQAQLARVYGPDGRFRFDFGGPGEGPGEFSESVFQIRIGPLDSIMVLDGWQMRLNTFGSDGAPAGTLPMRFGRGGGPYQFHLLGDRRLLVRWFAYNLEADGTFVPWDVLLLSNQTQTSFDTLMRFDYRPSDVGDRNRLLRPLISNVAFYDVLTDGSIVWSAREQDQLAVHALDGSLKRIIRNSRWELRPLSAADRVALLAAYRASSAGVDGPLPDNIVFPDTVPTITALQRSPDGGFWVRRMGPLSELDPQALFAPVQADWLGGTTWEVYDRDGQWRASVELPDRFRVTRVLDSAVVGVQRGELDVERVLLLRLLR